MPTENECTETRKQCDAERRARGQQAIETREPWETRDELARRANVSPSLIDRLLQTAPIDANCNSPEPEPYIPDQPWEDQPEIKALHKAFYRCSPEQRGYIWKHVLPLYDPGTGYRRMIP